jgi:hypothetical protein
VLGHFRVGGLLQADRADADRPEARIPPGELPLGRRDGEEVVEQQLTLFGCVTPHGLRPMLSTTSTPGSCSASRKAPAPTMPLAPRMISFMPSRLLHDHRARREHWQRAMRQRR